MPSHKLKGFDEGMAAAVKAGMWDKPPSFYRDDDPDETEGRRLSRMRAEAEARAVESIASRRVAMSPNPPDDTGE